VTDSAELPPDGGPPKRPRGDHPSEDEIARRLEHVEGVYAKTMSPSAAVASCIRPPPQGLGLDSRTIERYIARIRRRWLEEQEAERPIRTAQHRTAILRRIAGAERSGQYGAVVAGHRLLAEIDGVRLPERHVVALAGDAAEMAKLAALPIDDLRELDRIRAKLDAAEPAKPNGNGDDHPDEPEPEDDDGEPGA